MKILRDLNRISKFPACAFYGGYKYVYKKIYLYTHKKHYFSHHLFSCFAFAQPQFFCAFFLSCFLPLTHFDKHSVAFIIKKRERKNSRLYRIFLFIQKGMSWSMGREKGEWIWFFHITSSSSTSQSTTTFSLIKATFLLQCSFSLCLSFSRFLFAVVYNFIQLN